MRSPDLHRLPIILHRLPVSKSTPASSPPVGYAAQNRQPTLHPHCPKSMVGRAAPNQNQRLDLRSAVLLEIDGRPRPPPCRQPKHCRERPASPCRQRLLRRGLVPHGTRATPLVGHGGRRPGSPKAVSDSFVEVGSGGHGGCAGGGRGMLAT